ncbi:MAG: nucleotide-binding protein [bacterium]|nr:nucleotide-binding protein [bacterium]
MYRGRYTDNVFINCPFDHQYTQIFNAIVFTVFDCGYTAHCARELDDSLDVRINKITKIISECKYGIHDISRTELSQSSQLPRFNMPLELGLFMGAKEFGEGKQKQKRCLILDKEPYRYQAFISDIAGQDIRPHNNNDAEVIKLIRNWLRNLSQRMTIPGGVEILKRYRLFQSELPELCKELKLTIDEMTFNDYTAIINIWLKENP